MRLRKKRNLLKKIAKDIDRIVIGDDIYKCVCRYCYAGEDEVKLNL